MIVTRSGEGKEMTAAFDKEESTSIKLAHTGEPPDILTTLLLGVRPLLSRASIAQCLEVVLGPLHSQDDRHRTLVTNSRPGGDIARAPHGQLLSCSRSVRQR